MNCCLTEIFPYKLLIKNQYSVFVYRYSITKHCDTQLYQYILQPLWLMWLVGVENFLLVVDPDFAKLYVANYC